MKDEIKKQVIKSIVGSVIGAVVTWILGKIAAEITNNTTNTEFKIIVVLLSIIVGLIVALIFLLNSYSKYRQERVVLEQEKAGLEKEISSNLECIKEMKKNSSIYEEVGIIGCTTKLEKSGLEPLACMNCVKRRLDFMGVGGAKWFESNEKKRAFETMLNTVKTKKGRVRFLIIDPLGDGYKELRRLRKEHEMPKDSYSQYYQLSCKYKDVLEVRLYDHLPTLRMQFVDGEYVAVSRYYFESERYNQAARGWGIPHLIIHAEEIKPASEDPTKYAGSLYDSFEQLYDFVWEHSATFDQVIKKYGIESVDAMLRGL